MKDGDRIYVPDNPGTVIVRGAVNNPAIFQHKEGKGSSYYIQLAGGYLRSADKSAIIVHHPNGMAATVGFLSGPEILPGSVIDVPFGGESNEVELVTVRGAIRNPIMVQFRTGKTLDYYTNLSGGFREDADIDNVVVHQSDGKLIEKKGSAAFNPVIPVGSVIEVPFKTREAQTGVKPAAEKQEASKQEPVKIEKFLSGDVMVRGAVRNPGAARYRDDVKFDYYIAFCGGYAENADTDNLSIYMPDGKVVVRNGEYSFSPQIVPGCVIMVPTKEAKK
jgi:protein involved in polysaccharide export with SLBB domain